MMMMHDVMTHGGWAAAWPWLAVWIVLKLTVWALVITALIFGIRRLRHGACARALMTPLEILRTRYAKGELSREEFEAMKRELQTS